MNLSKSVKGSIAAVWGLVLIVVTIVGLIAYFGDSVSTTSFGALAIVTSALALILAYFSVVRARTAGLYVAVAAILLVAVMWNSAPKVKGDQYQAVFLTNGQVYFGHLKNPNASSPVLTSIYYLQSQAAQPNSGSTTTSTAKTAQTQLSLVKLGGELHGPEDSMALKSNQILFWENLKNDSKVVQAINNQKK